MAMPQPRMDWTWDRWEALPENDGNRYEIIDGELLVSASPSWTHQRVLALLFAEIFPYLMRLGNHEILFAPGGVRFSDRRVLQPDLTAWRFSGDGAGAAVVGDTRTLILTVEALSPSTARYDRYKKRPVFQQHAVPEYWIVDADARFVERWRPEDADPEVLVEELTWQPVAGAPSLVIDLPHLFRGAHLEL